MNGELPERETLTVEFKSDRPALHDDDLVAAAACLANAEGGAIFVGIEDDGRVSGLDPRHREPSRVAALIANRTVPPLSVRAVLLPIGDSECVRIDVPKSVRIVATSVGLVQRRVIGADGKPACVPMYPHEYDRRLSDLGRLDISDRPVDEASTDDLDPLERVRLRQAIARYGGDAALAALDDEELDGALGLSITEGGHRVPTLTGLLLLGTEQALRRHLPAHAIAFQVLDGTDVRVNTFWRLPLLRAFEQVMEQFAARVVEHELQVGLFRVPVPSYDERAFREALANAIVHRDYTRLGAVHVQMRPDEIAISNPGGFVEGVTLDNLLVTDPRPRNPTLADAFKRIGLVERTGRGVDIIFERQLRFGRPAPDYSGSTATSVRVVMPGGEADIGFLEVVVEQEQRSGTALRLLRDEPPVRVGTLARLIQRDERAARQVLVRLIAAGLAESRGTGGGVIYSLSSTVYRRMGRGSAYIRQRGFAPLQQEQMVLQFVQSHGAIKRAEVADLCQLTLRQAQVLLHRLTANGRLRLVGKGRTSRYEYNG